MHHSSTLKISATIGLLLSLSACVQGQGMGLGGASSQQIQPSPYLAISPLISTAIQANGGTPAELQQANVSTGAAMNQNSKVCWGAAGVRQGRMMHLTNGALAVRTSGQVAVYGCSAPVGQQALNSEGVRCQVQEQTVWQEQPGADRVVASVRGWVCQPQPNDYRFMVQQQAGGQPSAAPAQRPLFDQTFHF